MGSSDLLGEYIEDYVLSVAIICGIAGQDGSLLGKYLRAKGYDVHGTSRLLAPASDRSPPSDSQPQIPVWQVDLTDISAVSDLIERIQPDEIYNLSGPTSVSASFTQPLEALVGITSSTASLLEAIRLRKPSARFFSAGSTECFGETQAHLAADETTALSPKSPYGVAKAAALMQVANYREAFGLFVCSGTLSNHESPHRPRSFVFPKIVSAAVAISRGGRERLALGNTTVVRDWGWAPEYVDAMWRMLQQETPRDYVIATGESHALKAVAAKVFAAVGLDWRDHVDFDDTLVRPLDIGATYANPSRAREELGWVAKTRLAALVDTLVARERALYEPER